MTTVKISIHQNSKKAIFFALGVSLIVIIQASIAVGFSKLLLESPMYLTTIQKAGTVIFIGLSIFFFSKGIQSKNEGSKKTEIKVKGFVSGLLFSSLNMFAIPFYFGVTSFLIAMHWYDFNINNNMLFVLGSSFGTFFLLYLYSQLAKKIEKRIQHLANKMDVILGTVTGIIAIVNTVDLLI